MAHVTPLPPPAREAIELDESRRLYLVENLGRGNAAAVYRGYLEGGSRLKRAVAVKVFDVASSDERDIVIPRLARVARHSACVHHPNVASVTEFGLFGPAEPYFIGELVQGRSLAAFMEALVLAGQRMPLDLALFIGTEIAEGLIGARLAISPDDQRQIGVVHGDLSMREVLLSWNGEVKVTDFGVSRAVGAASTVRRIGMLARRAATVAPEVACGQKGDARSDVFSLGVLLHEILVGPRFPSTMSDTEMLDMASEGFVDAPMFAPQLPADIRTLVERALEVDPSRRFPHSGAVAYELRRAAMAMGVGDGRLFLRHAMQNVLDQTMSDESDERPVAAHSLARSRR